MFFSNYLTDYKMRSVILIVVFLMGGGCMYAQYQQRRIPIKNSAADEKAMKTNESASTSDAKKEATDANSEEVNKENPNPVRLAHRGSPTGGSPRISVAALNARRSALEDKQKSETPK
jgi:hypothetical protein